MQPGPGQPGPGQPGQWPPQGPGQPGPWQQGPGQQPGPWQQGPWQQPVPPQQSGPWQQPGPWSQGPWQQGPWQHPGPGQAGPWGRPPRPRAQLTPEQRRRRIRGLLTFFGVLVLAVGVGIGIGAWIAPTAPVTVAKALVTKSIAAATAAGSYHYVELATASGQPDDITGDATTAGGRQVITEIGSNGTDVFDLRLVDGVVYFRGNTAATIDQLGVPTTESSTVSGKWVSVKKGEGVYKKFADGITVASNLSQITTTFVASHSAAMPGTQPATTRITGGLFAGKGKTPVGSAALVIDSSSDLPRTLDGGVTGSSGKYRFTWTFTHFGEKITLKAPAGAVAYSSLHATAPKTTKG